MARSMLQELKQELTPYMIHQELIDETDSERIGNGAYGVVTKAKYCRTPCALKELHSFLLPQLEARDEANSRGDSSQSVEKFGTKIKLLSELRHPNLVPFIGVYFRENSPFLVLVMELMHTSLAKCLEQYECDQQKFPLSTKLFILQDVARALVYLHSQKPPIIHCDLTASNVMLTSDMRAKLAELGVAKIIDPDLLKKSTQCPGNVVYMPPEALMEQPTYGTEIDVYSFGVLGFQIFSGKWPLHHGALKDDKSRLSDKERCHAHLIGEGFCLSNTLESCLNSNPKMRLSATNILAIITGVLTDYKMEYCDFLEAQYCMVHRTVLLEESSQQLASLSTMLTSKEQDIHKLENSERENALVIEQLRGDNKDLKSMQKLLEKKSTDLAQEVEMLKKVVASQEETMAATMNTIIENSLPCEQCSTLEKEKKDLSDFIGLLQEKITILSNEIQIKDEEVLNKKKETELKEQEIKSLKERIKLLEVEAGFKSNIDTVFTTSSKELSERNTELLGKVEVLNKQLIERNERQKIVQDYYRKIIQDLLVTHKVCTLLISVCICVCVCVCVCLSGMG